jgi:hypothetical protein
MRGAVKRLGAPVRALGDAREARQTRRPPPYVPAPQEKARVRARLERMLLENVVPFWEPTTDREFGGYRFNHDPQGTWLGPGWKTTANQARIRRVLVPEKHVLAQAYGLCALAEHCRAVSDPRALALAQQVFVVTKMKDHRYGGDIEGFSRSWRPQSIFRRNVMAKAPVSSP